MSEYHRLFTLSIFCLLLSSAQGQSDRSYDGTGNNVNNPSWGASLQSLVRMNDAVNSYADGIGAPRTDLPSARVISNIVFSGNASILSFKNLTDMATYWGQFIDHDISAASPSVNLATKEYANIPVPRGDEWMDPNAYGNISMSFGRSPYLSGTGNTTIREIVNYQSAYLDASMIYGPSSDVINQLRIFQGGFLLTSKFLTGETAPPVGVIPMENSAGRFNSSKLFSCGDHRANENPGLLSLQTIFLREHNRLARQFAVQNDTLNDEQLFQKARSWVIALIQHITDSEYIPAILGTQSVYNGYDPTLNANLMMEFSSGAFRYGHSEVNPSFNRYDSSGDDIGSVDLFSSFYNPTIYNVGVDPYLRGMASTTGLAVDTNYPTTLRNFLFSVPGAGGHDLIAMNIQRGRDHGLVSYNEIRLQFGLTARTSFDQVTSNATVAAALAEAYNNSIDACEIYVCGIAEDPYVNGSIIANVGETYWTILTEQYRRLRHGDRYYYKNTDNGLFNLTEVSTISATRLKDVIERNTAITGLQCQVMVAGTACQDASNTPSSPIATDGSVLLYTVYPGSPTKVNVNPYATYSWYMNKVEVPVIYLTSGVKYTFIVQAQAAVHAFVIASTPDGSSSIPGVGSGSSGVPVYITPDINQYTELYYSCNQHQWMGNKIVILPNTAQSGSGTVDQTRSTPLGQGTTSATTADGTTSATATATADEGSAVTTSTSADPISGGNVLMTTWIVLVSSLYMLM